MLLDHWLFSPGKSTLTSSSFPKCQPETLSGLAVSEPFLKDDKDLNVLPSAFKVCTLFLNNVLFLNDGSSARGMALQTILNDQIQIFAQPP